MAAGSQGSGLVDGLRIDLKHFHESWMELWFPRQRGADHSVLGKWTPSTQSGMIAYRVWAALGVPVVGLAYPLVLLGYVLRFHAAKVDGTAARLGLVGVLVLSVLVWGGLTLLARVRFSAEGFLAVAAAGLVATLAAVAAAALSRVDSRPVVVLLAYPAAMTAIFLPPVVAAFYSPTLASVVFSESELLAERILTALPFPSLEAFLRTRYELEGVTFLVMWLGIAIPVGWLVGGVVSLASVVRPQR